MRKVFSFLSAIILTSMTGLTVNACSDNSKASSNFSEWSSNDKNDLISRYVILAWEFWTQSKVPSSSKEATWGSFTDKTYEASSSKIQSASYMGLLGIILEKTGVVPSKFQKDTTDYISLIYNVKDPSYNRSTKLNLVFQTGFTLEIVGTKNANQFFTGAMELNVKDDFVE